MQRQIQQQFENTLRINKKRPDSPNLKISQQQISLNKSKEKNNPEIEKIIMYKDRKNIDIEKRSTQLEKRNSEQEKNILEIEKNNNENENRTSRNKNPLDSPKFDGKKSLLKEKKDKNDSNSYETNEKTMKKEVFSPTQIRKSYEVTNRVVFEKEKKFKQKKIEFQVEKQIEQPSLKNKYNHPELDFLFQTVVGEENEKPYHLDGNDKM